MQVVTETTQQIKQRNKADKMRKSEKRKEKVKALKIGKKVKLLALVVGFFGVGLGVKSFFDWTNSNQVEFRNPLIIAVQSPIVVTPKKLNVVETVNQIVYGEDVVEIEKGSVEDMILQRWGKDAPTAIAVFRAESGLRCDAYNVNTNMTVDVGITQLNSIHFNEEFTITDAVDCEKNLDRAYAMWQEQGWTPWVAAHKLGLVN